MVSNAIYHQDLRSTCPSSQATRNRSCPWTRTNLVQLTDENRPEWTAIDHLQDPVQGLHRTDFTEACHKDYGAPTGYNELQRESIPNVLILRGYRPHLRSCRNKDSQRCQQLDGTLNQGSLALKSEFNK